jgi:colicin import membrane protein
MAADLGPGGGARWPRSPGFPIRYRGYDRDEVEDFVDEAMRAIRRLQERIDELEEWLQRSEEDAVRNRFRAVKAEHRRAEAEERAERAEAVQGKLRETLELAQRTRRQVVADAEERADSMYSSAVTKARAEVAAEYRRIFEEADKLDALRLAVAAERMALDEVRSDIRSRIGAAAAELNRIADSQYLLGTSRQAKEPGDPSPEMVQALREMVNAQRRAERS